MEQYIDKDDVVTEIEKYKKEALERLTTSIERSMRRQIKDKAWVSLCQNLLSFIDTLEVKEVDLEKEIQRQYNVHKNPDNSIAKDCVIMTKDGFEYFAKYFFELGLKAQKGK